MVDLRERFALTDRLDVPDLWQRSLTSADRMAADGSGPSLELDLPRRSSGRQRLTAAVVALAVFGAALVFAWVGLGNGRLPFVASGPMTIQDPMGIPIEVTYPNDWEGRALTIPAPRASAAGLLLAPQIGAIIANTPAAIPSDAFLKTHPGESFPDGQVPSNFVIVTVLGADTGDAPTGQPDSTLPLSMEHAQVVPGPGNVRTLHASLSGWPITITVQSGPDASLADLAAADAIVASIRPTNVTATPEPSETATGRDVFAHGSDLLAGPWRLFSQQTDSGPVFGVLMPGQQTFTTELAPLGDRTFGAWLLSGVSANTQLLAQMVSPSVARAEIKLDDGTVVPGELVDLPRALGGPAKFFVAGFSSVMSVEGQHLKPNGYVVAYAPDGRELAHRRLTAG